ncbi:MAG: hypothetical protein GKS06_17580 [Acidobacteria bacterium]|nr:hypothetical protein [Acidobacteriota bacterium]
MKSVRVLAALLCAFIAISYSLRARSAPGVSKGASQLSEVAAELKLLYEQDQADRTFDSPPTQEQWQEITTRDELRRDRVIEIIGAGQLDTGDDYYHAAMVLQHASGSDDIMTAHILATVAGFKGHEGGQWLSAAALDRYLHRTDSAQRLGTQFIRRTMEEPWSLGDYDDWLPDSVRSEFGVPPRSEQEARVKSMNAR